MNEPERSSSPTDFTTPTSVLTTFTRSRATSDAIDKYITSQAHQLQTTAQAWRSRYPLRLDFFNPFDSDFINNLKPINLFNPLNRSPSLRPKYHFSDEILSGESDVEEEEEDPHSENLTLTTDSKVSDQVNLPDGFDSSPSVKATLKKQSPILLTRLTRKAIKVWNKSQKKELETSDRILVWLAACGPSVSYDL